MKVIDFIPPVVLNAWRRVKPVHYPTSPLLVQNKRGERITLIGNGPSLKKTVKLYGEEILKYDRMVVNYFAMTDYYVRFKPNYYLIIDPVFFKDDSAQKESAAKLVETIASKTQWSMLLCVPTHAIGSKNLQKILENKNITCTYIDVTPRKSYKLSKFEMWDKNWTCPPMQNALNASLYLALFWEYSEIYIVGVDMSGLEEIRVDQETNEMFSIDTHFYDSATMMKADNKLYDKSKRKILSNEWTMHEYLQAYAQVFEHFYDLNKYAIYKGVNVYNASEYSWVNCFERKKLE